MCAYTRSATKNKNKIKAGKYRADYDADTRSEIASNGPRNFTALIKHLDDETR